MTMKSALLRVFNLVCRFGSEQNANVAITFALATLPVIGAVGAAVDFSHANSVKVAMQSALDSTALMLAKDAPNLTEQDLDTKALAYFNALFTRPEGVNITVDARYTTVGGSKIVVDGSANVPTIFMEAMGYDNITVDGSSTTRWGTAHMRVALVLDNTGSMESDGKMDALKDATKSLLKQLKAAATNDGDVYVSIIPFSKDVNFGTGYDEDDPLMTDQIDWTAWDEQHGHCSDGSDKSYSQCISANDDNSCHDDDDNDHDGHDGDHDDNDHDHHSYWDGNGFDRADNPLRSLIVKVSYGGGGYGGGYGGGDYGGGGYGGGNDHDDDHSGGNDHDNDHSGGSGGDGDCGQTITWEPNNYSTWAASHAAAWTGCITDRGGKDGPDSENYDQTVVAPDPDVAASKYPADTDDNNCPPLAMKGLSYDWSGMKKLVKSMEPKGSTNQPIGLVWGWQSLVGGGPFTAPPKDPNLKYEQYIILLSDGLNTQNRWDGNGRDQSDDVDDRMRDSDGDGTCANIKAADVTIYTLQVNTGGDPTSTLLKKCASDPGKFFLITKANDISSAFDAIATDITKLRVAK
jgi:Flp pilus assembly protein TadG